MAQRKPSSSWTLRFQSRPDYSSLARFTDALDAAQLAAGRGRSRMYFQEEDLREDPEDEVQRDGEFASRRTRQRRKFYRRKQTIVLEHPLASAPPLLGGEQPLQHYEGKPVSVDFNPEGDANLPRASSSSASSSSSSSSSAMAVGGEEQEQDKEQPFKYVLLQFVKTEEGAVPEIHVHPVGDFFTFRKTGKPRDDLLGEIEDKDKEEQERQAALLSRYKAISQTISNYESKRREEEKRSEQRGQASALDSFSQAMMKVFSKKKQDSGRQNAALDEDMNAGLGVYMDENGLDPDALKEHDFCGGDYGVRFADDEEDHVIQEQEVQTRQSEQEMTSMSRYDEGLDEDEESEEEAGEEGSGAEGGEGRENGAQDLGSRELEAQANRAQSGIVNNAMLNATMAVSKMLMQSQRAATAAAATAAATSSSLLGVESSDSGGAAEGLGGGPTKRSLKSLDLGAETAKRVKFADGSAGDVPSSSGAVTSGSEDLASASLMDVVNATASSLTNTVQTPGDLSSQQEYTLSESGVRKYILHRGGRVSVKELSDFFKPIIKAYSKALPNKLAGRDKFLDTLEAVTRQVDDPLLGRAVELRDSHK